MSAKGEKQHKLLQEDEDHQKEDAQLEKTTARHKTFRRAHVLTSTFPTLQPKKIKNSYPWQTEYSANFRPMMQTVSTRFPRGTMLHPTSTRPTIYYPVPKGKAVQSEYQASYTARAKQGLRWGLAQFKSVQCRRRKTPAE